MRLIVFIILYFYSYQFSNGQFEVNYNVNFIGYKTDRTHISKDALKYYQEQLLPSINILNASEGVLHVCNNQSYFSIIANPKHDLERNIFAQVSIETSSWITTTNEAGNMDRRYKRIIVSDYLDESWKIETDHKIIAGYTCYRATKNLVSKEFPIINRVLEVWFTPEISVPSGFMQATGLPGFVLYYNDQKTEFTAVKIVAKKSCSISIPKMERISFTSSNKEAAARMQERKQNRKK